MSALSERIRLLDPGYTRPLMDHDELSAGVLCDYDYSNKSKLQERFAAHYQSLGELDVDRILRYRVQEGWEPLCRFLDLPIPERSFPRENDANHFVELGAQSARQGYINSARNVFGGALLVLTISLILTRSKYLRSSI